MAHISQFDAYEARFTFEPPVDVGEQTIDSLQKIVALAFLGSAASALAVRAAEAQAEVPIAYSSELGPSQIAVVLNQMLHGMHMVSIV